MSDTTKSEDETAMAIAFRSWERRRAVIRELPPAASPVVRLGQMFQTLGALFHFDPDMKPRDL